MARGNDGRLDKVADAADHLPAREHLPTLLHGAGNSLRVSKAAKMKGSIKGDGEWDGMGNWMEWDAERDRIGNGMGWRTNGMRWDDTLVKISTECAVWRGPHRVPGARGLPTRMCWYDATRRLITSSYTLS